MHKYYLRRTDRQLRQGPHARMVQKRGRLDAPHTPPTLGLSLGIVFARHIVHHMCANDSVLVSHSGASTALLYASGGWLAAPPR